MIKRNTTPVIDAISEMRITGNIKPPIWRKTIVYTNSKGTFHHSDAADLLADIRYWYTRQEIRDERTSEIIEYRKRFKEDKLQRSYNDVAEYLNCSMKLARQAVKFLADLGVITLEFRNIKQSGGTLFNVMYMELVPSVLHRLTYPDSQMGTTVFPNGKTKKPKRENGKAHLGGTYTENTTKNTNINNNSVSHFANAKLDGAGSISVSANNATTEIELTPLNTESKMQQNTPPPPADFDTRRLNLKTDIAFHTRNLQDGSEYDRNLAKEVLPTIKIELAELENAPAKTPKNTQVDTKPVSQEITPPRAPKVAKVGTLHKQCVAWFCETFYPERYGTKYAFQGGKDAKAVTTILANLKTTYPTLSDETVFELFKKMFAETQNEWVIKCVHAPAHVALKFNEINVELKAKKKPHAQAKPKPYDPNDQYK